MVDTNQQRVTVETPYISHYWGLHRIFRALGGVHVVQSNMRPNVWEFPAETAERAQSILGEFTEAVERGHPFAHYEVQGRYERELGIARLTGNNTTQLWEECSTCGGDPCTCFDGQPETASGEIYGGAR